MSLVPPQKVHHSDSKSLSGRTNTCWTLNKHLTFFRIKLTFYNLCVEKKKRGYYPIIFISFQNVSILILNIYLIFLYVIKMTLNPDKNAKSWVKNENKRTKNVLIFVDRKTETVYVPTKVPF